MNSARIQLKSYEFRSNQAEFLVRRGWIMTSINLNSGIGLNFWYQAEFSGIELNCHEKKGTETNNFLQQQSQSLSCINTMSDIDNKGYARSN